MARLRFGLSQSDRRAWYHFARGIRNRSVDFGDGHRLGMQPRRKEKKSTGGKHERSRGFT